MDVAALTAAKAGVAGGDASDETRATLGNVLGQAPQAPQITDPGAKSTLEPFIAQLFNGAISKQASLNVSWRVSGQTGEIVTIYTDPSTGREVAQFPPQLFAELAAFLDQHQGVALDRNA